MASFSERLNAVKRRGNLRDADLARWLGRRQSTVKGWLQGREPAGTPSEIRGLFSEVVKIEAVIASKALPVPWMPSARRIAYMTRLKRRK